MMKHVFCSNFYTIAFLLYLETQPLIYIETNPFAHPYLALLYFLSLEEYLKLMRLPGIKLNHLAIALLG